MRLNGFHGRLDCLERKLRVGLITLRLRSGGTAKVPDNQVLNVLGKRWGLRSSLERRQFRLKR